MRKELWKLAHRQLSVGSLERLISSTKNSPSHGFLHHIFLWCWNHFSLNYRTKCEMISLPTGICQFFKSLASVSPVCSYLPPSAVNLAHALIEENIKQDLQKFRKVQLDLPIFFQLLKDVNEPKLPESFKGCILHLINQCITPFKESHHVGSLEPNSEGSPLAL